MDEHCLEAKSNGADLIIIKAAQKMQNLRTVE